MTFKKILVPLDGSENSEKVQGWITALAKDLKAEISLLSVVHGPEHSGPDATKQAQEAASAYLNAQAAKAGAGGVQISTLVKTGLPAETIISAATEIQADMIAMATHRENVLARGILGSVTDSVLRTAEIPVLAINPDDTQASAGSPSSIIVPLDGSKLAATAVPVALEIADACGARLIFIRTVHLPGFAVTGPGAEFYGTDYGVSAERAKATEYLSQFVAQAEAKGLSAEVHAALGNAASRIIEDTRNIPDSMIIITSHGRGGFKRLLLGSVADKIVRASHQPVLVLKNQ